MSKRVKHIIILIALIACAAGLQSQSTSFGNTFVHNDGESVIFGTHDFDEGSGGTLPGIIGTQRTTNNASYGILGFSDVSGGWKDVDDDAHVDGYVKKYGDDAFVFPIGDNGKFRPVAIDGGDGTIAAYFQADPTSAITNTLFGGNFQALPAGGPFPRTSKRDDVVNVSDIEYWDIDGSNATHITLTWDIFSEIERITNDDLDRLSILGWDGSQWTVIPSEIDVLYLRENRSRPSFTGGISNKVRGSITTASAIVPDDFIVYTFGSFASGSIGDFVWEDLNRNGLQEVGEPGIEGVEIELVLNSNDSTIMVTESDEDGNYKFLGVQPDIYYLKFAPGVTYAPTLPNQGIQANNSDLNFRNETAPFQLDINESLFNIDAGFYETGSIGDFVWLDNNNNGIQDGGESGVGDVRVELLNGDGEVIAATTTNPDGSYAFTNLPPSDYKIGVVPPTGFGIGPYKATLDGDADSDIEPASGQSETIFLISGQVIENIDAALSAECAYTAELDITAPECGTSNGDIQVIIEGDTGPYTYEWSTGATTPFLADIDTGTYTLIISDVENCLRTFTIPVGYAEDCNMVCAQLNVQVYLEGTFDYDAGIMNKKLNELGYLPGQQPTTFLGQATEAGHPYDQQPWFMGSTTGATFESRSIAENNLYYPDDVVDWVLVSLRSTESIEYETCTRAGMLHQDGTISFDENDCCLVDPTREYYVVIEHRNHLIVMTPRAMPVIDREITFDFRANNSFVRLVGSGQKEISPGVFAMYAANGDQYTSSISSTDINVGDLSEWLKENGDHSSYYLQDYNLNGDANVQDKGIYLENIGVFSDVLKNN